MIFCIQKSVGSEEEDKDEDELYSFDRPENPRVTEEDKQTRKDLKKQKRKGSSKSNPSASARFGIPKLGTQAAEGTSPKPMHILSEPSERDDPGRERMSKTRKSVTFFVRGV